MSIYVVNQGVSKIGTLCDGVKMVLDAAKDHNDLPGASLIVVRMLPTVSYSAQPRFTISPVGIKTEQPDRTLAAIRTITVNVSMTQSIEFGDDDAATDNYRAALSHVEKAEEWLAGVTHIEDGTTAWLRDEIDVIPSRPPMSAESADQWSEFTSTIQLSFIEGECDD